MDDFSNKIDDSIEDMPFVFPDLETDRDDKTNIPLGSGTITSLLGKGGMANVYEIWNSDLEVNRAVKLIHPTCTEIERDRFDTEIKITAKLHHPYIVEIHGVGKWNGLSYLEMEKINGVTLKEFIKGRGALPVAVCTAIGIMICQALQYAHDQEYIIYGKKYHGIIHRDLKPSNIMLCTDGNVKLMDFGIARPTDASFHTMDGTVVGTIHYLPPEQLKGEELDRRTDIYALAATLYEILTGFRAFPENNLSKLMAEKSKNHYKPISDYTIKVPGKFKRIIHKCMHHNREKRIPSADKLLQELNKIHTGVTAENPQQVIKNLVNTRSYEKIIITPRSHLLRNLSIAAVFILLIGLSIAPLRRYINYLQTKRTALVAAKEKKDSNAAQQVRDPLAEYRKQIDQTKTLTTVKPEKEKRVKPVVEQNIQKSKDIVTRDTAVTIIKTFIDSIRDTYNTDNLLEIMAMASRAHKYTDVLRVCDALTEKDRSSTHALIYKLRTLIGLKNQENLNTFLSAHQVEDGEFYLEKAKSAYLKKDLDKAEYFLTMSFKTPCKILDRSILKQEVYYYRALCSTVRFDADPSEENYKNTLGTWHQLKGEMKNNPQHFYYKKAITEMQRIGTKYRNNEG